MDVKVPYNNLNDINVFFFYLRSTQCTQYVQLWVKTFNTIYMKCQY